MKILSITSLFPNSKEPNKGIFILNRLKALNKYAEIQVIAPIPYFPIIRPRKVPFKEGIEGLIIYHPRFFSIPKFFKFLDGYFFYLSLKKFKRKIKQADIIDTHFAWPDGYGSWLIAKKQKKKFSITIRGSDVNYWLKRNIIKNKIKKMFKESNLIISVSKRLKDILPINKIKIISNGVDTFLFKPINKIKTRKNLNLPLNKKIILSVGRPFKLKGFFELVKSAKDLNALVCLIGEDKNKKDLVNFIRKNKIKNVKLIGKIKHEELPKWYSAADIFTLISHSEGWPNVIMEALACGKPCVVTKEAAGEFITKDLGIVTNYNHLTENLEKALKKKWNKQIILKFAKENSWDKTAKKVYEEFKKIL